MLKTPEVNYKMMHNKFRTQSDIFPGKAAKVVKLDPSKLKVCEVGFRTKPDCEMAYRQIRFNGKMQYACDRCIAEIWTITLIILTEIRECFHHGCK